MDWPRPLVQGHVPAQMPRASPCKPRACRRVCFHELACAHPCLRGTRRRPRARNPLRASMRARRARHTSPVRIHACAVHRDARRDAERETHRETQRDRERERETLRDTLRDTQGGARRDAQTHRAAVRDTERHIERYAERHTKRPTGRHTTRHTDTRRDTLEGTQKHTAQQPSGLGCKGLSRAARPRPAWSTAHLYSAKSASGSGFPGQLLDQKRPGDRLADCMSVSVSVSAPVTAPVPCLRLCTCQCAYAYAYAVSYTHLTLPTTPYV